MTNTLDSSKTRTTRLPESRAPRDDESPIKWDQLTDEDRRRSEIEQTMIDIAAGR